MATAVGTAPLWLQEAERDGSAIATVRFLIRNGNEDVGSLTNTAFFLSHPELPWGIKLQPGENPEHQALATEWVRLRDEMVRPELQRLRAARTAPAGPAPASPPPAAPAAGRAQDAPAGGSTDSRTFLAAHREVLAQLPTADEAELLFLLDHVLAHGSGTVIEYHAYNYMNPRRAPLTHSLFQRRHPGTDPLTSLVSKDGKRYAAMISSWDKVAESLGGWDAAGVTPAHWEEIKSIRDDIVYPLMRIVLPRIEGAGPLVEGAAIGQRIAHRAHTYLGVRYATGDELLKERGRLKGQNPEAADPSGESGAMDCSTLVHRVIVDMGLPGPGYTTGAMRTSPLMVEVTDPEPGDVLFRPGHVGIFVGNGKVIEAPHTGRVVSMTDYRGLGDGKKGTWTAILRYQPPSSQ